MPRRGAAPFLSFISSLSSFSPSARASLPSLCLQKQMMMTAHTYSPSLPPSLCRSESRRRLLASSHLSLPSFLLSFRPSPLRPFAISSSSSSSSSQLFSHSLSPPAPAFPPAGVDPLPSKCRICILHDHHPQHNTGRGTHRQREAHFGCILWLKTHVITTQAATLCASAR